MAITKLENLVNPEVVADTISFELEKAIKFTPIAVTDKTLVGQAGNSIGVPKYSYIGAAEDYGEGEEISTTTLTATMTPVTIKKAAKAVEITDEAMLSGTGKPIDEATKQLTTSIADKIDNDILAQLKTDSDAKVVGSATTAFSLNLVSDALDEFNDEVLGEKKYLFVNPLAMGILRKDETFTHASQLGDTTLMTGVVGTVYGCQVVPTRKLEATESLLVKEGAVTLYIKRDVNVETARNILTKTTTISADEHYVAATRDVRRFVRLSHKSPKTA